MPTSARPTLTTNRPALRLLAASVLLAFAGTGWAQEAATQSLTELYQAAKGYDAAYLAAKAQADSVQYRARQVKAQRLPQVGARVAVNRQYFDADSRSTVDNNPLLGGSGNASQTVKSYSLQARQALFNQTVSNSVDQAEASVLVAAADLQLAENDLVVRLAQAYFDVLASRDVLVTAQANKKAVAEQLASAKRNFEVGNATITDTREAQARFDLATAQEIAALNEVLVKGLALDQLVGRSKVQPRPLMSPVQMPVLEPASAEDWVSYTLGGPLVRKAELGRQVSTLETQKARSEYMPTADLVAAITKTDSDGGSSLATLNNSGVSSSIGVEVNMALFSGFATQNKVRETLSLEERSQQDLENARRSTALATRQAFFGVQSGLAQVKALEAAEGSARLALEATQLGYRVGVRVTKDVLDAQNQLTNTQRDLYKARYDVLVGTMKLRQASGSLKPEDLESLNRLLAPQ